MLVHPQWKFLSALCCFCMIATIQGRPPNSQNRPNDGGVIVFPGFTTTVRPNIETKGFIPKIEGEYPQCANGSTFCEEDNSYPTEYVENLLRNLDNKLFINKDELEIDIKDRLNENQYSFCEFEEQIANPRIAQNKDGKWKFVINQKEFYVQGVRVEICKRKKQPCGYVELSNVPAGFITSCEQKYTYRSLLSLGENGNAVSDSFILPSCCSCQIKMIDPASRIGLVRPNSSPATTRSQPAPKLLSFK